MMKNKKSLRLFDIVSFSFSAVFVLDSFAAAAAIGWQSIIYWIILILFYFAPYGLITSELGSTYSNGGIYVWVKKALGIKWALRCNWFYWLNVGLWMSSVYIAFSSSISIIFFPENPLSMWNQILIAIFITWITVLLGLVDIKYLKWIPNLSSISKLIVTIALILAAIVWLVNGNRIGTEIYDKDFGIFPSWAKGLIFLPVIIYNLSGFELSSNVIEDMKNPKRDIPLSILISGLTICLSYIIGTIAINLIMDVKHLDISNGIISTISKVSPSWLTKILAIFLLFTFFGNMITWTTGANRAMQEAAQYGEFPKLFATKLKNNQPLLATIITGIITTILLLIAGLFSKGNTISDLFWQLYSFSSIIFLLPYIFIFPSYLVLRKKDKLTKRPFKIPGNMFIQWIITIFPSVFLFFAILLFIFGQIIVGEKSWNWDDGGQFVTFNLIGTTICIMIGEFLMWFAKKQNETRR